MKIIVENIILYNYKELWTRHHSYRRYTATDWQVSNYNGTYGIIKDPEYIAELESAYQDYIKESK